MGSTNCENIGSIMCWWAGKLHFLTISDCRFLRFWAPSTTGIFISVVRTSFATFSNFRHHTQESLVLSTRLTLLCKQTSTVLFSRYTCLCRCWENTFDLMFQYPGISFITASTTPSLMIRFFGANSTLRSKSLVNPTAKESLSLLTGIHLPFANVR